MLVRGLSPNATEDATSRLRRHALGVLPFRPEDVVSQRLAPDVHLFSASANDRFSTHPPFSRPPEGPLLVSGLPTFETVPTDRLTSLLRNDPDTLFSDIGGCWNVGALIDGRLTALSSFEGYHSVFYLDDGRCRAVGNRASLLALLTQEGEVPRPSVESLAWIFSKTMILGDTTAFAGVQKLRPGWLLNEDASGWVVRELRESPWTPLETEDPRARDDAIGEALERLRKRVGWLLDHDLPVVAHLTGGKDTRAIAALLFGSGRLESMTELRTTGTEESGDVILARRVAEALGASRKHAVNAGQKRTTVDLSAKGSSVEYGRLSRRSHPEDHCCKCIT